MTTMATTPTMNDVCCGASLVIVMVTLTPTSLGQISSGQQELALWPQFILRDILRYSAGLTCVLQQHLPQSWVPSQVYARYAMGLPQVSFSVEPPSDSSVMCLVSAMVFGCCFQVPIWLPCSSVGAYLLGFVTPQPFGVYPW